MSTTDDPPSFAAHPTADGWYPVWIDWLLGAIIALAGLMTIVGGSTLTFVVDPDVLETHIENGETITVVTHELTEAETLDFVATVTEWTGIGLLVTGVGLVVFGGGYVWRRHRSHQRTDDDEMIDSYWGFAILGALTTALLSFLTLSPLLGGALAGYLERAESDRTISVGALAGVLPAIPLLVVIIFFFIGVINAMLAVEAVGVAIVIGSTMLFAVLLIAVIAAGLGAAGGFIGGWFAEWQARE